MSTGWLLRLRGCLSCVCGIEWYCCVALGISTATLSYAMDLSVTKLIRAHKWLYRNLEGNSLLQFLCWTLYPACLCAVASSFSDSICPFSTGSGIPEVRTMLSGVQMPHYSSLTNLFAKFLGLTCTLAAGSTVFLGKVGPFVHLSTMLAGYLSNMCSLISDNSQVKSGGEMLTAAAAVGVSSCFGAPVSGVLFSMEVMSSHFALNNYYPCFFTAACGALTFRLFSVWSGEEETLQAVFQTHFSTSLHFLPEEILLFIFLGLLCGVVSCCYLCCHRRILEFTKTNSLIIKMLKTEKGLYSGVVVFLLASVTFPNSAGRFMASEHTMKQLLTSLLDDTQWTSISHNASVREPPEPGLQWGSSESPAFLSLAVFLIMKPWMLLLSCTLPLPAGFFMPVFIYGAALGRLLVEVVHVSSTTNINPGSYVLAGAAAFSGAVTHTLSPALLTVELTGQFSHAVPVLIATLIANAVARRGNRLSFYDALSVSKRLPHLASLTLASPQLSMTPVGRVLGGKTFHLQRSAGSEEIRLAVNTGTQTQIPVVDSHGSPIFLGFVLRSELLSRRAETAEERLEEVCHIHQDTVQISPHVTVQEADRILNITGAQTLFVTEAGRLVGLLTQQEMKRILEDLAKEI
ncbi:chloride channel K [Synchiropus picturatus]